MSNDFSPWQNHNPLWLNNVVSRINEITRPAINVLQNLQDTMKPLLGIIEQYKLHLNEVGKALAKASRPLTAIEKMGAAQFVYWDYMTEEYVESIVNSENINKTLREQMQQDRFCKVNDTIDKIFSSPEMHKLRRLFSQSVKAFRNGDSDLAVSGFTSVFDGLLSDVSKNPSSSLTPRIKTIKEKLDNDELLDHNEYAMLTLALTFEKTLDSFSAFSNFSKKEPKGLNRHWIAHGRSTRKKTKLDCVKMINLIYGLLLIEQLDSLETTN